jgi:hypothetical protein
LVGLPVDEVAIVEGHGVLVPELLKHRGACEVATAE